MQVKNVSNNDFFKNSKYVVSVRAHKTWEPLYCAIRDKNLFSSFAGQSGYTHENLKICQLWSLITYTNRNLP